MEYFIKRIICFFSFLLLLLFIDSCVLLPFECKKYDIAPENFITQDLNSNVKFYYSKEKTNLDSENILIYGNFSFPYYKNTGKSVLSYEYEKRKWNFNIKSYEFSINDSSDFLIFFNDVEKFVNIRCRLIFFTILKLNFRIE